MTATPESMRRMQRRREQLAGIVRPRGGQPGVKRGPMRLKEEWPSRFERCIAYEPMTGCWLWIGTATRHGYGVTSVHMRKVLVHRESWRMHRGDIPDGLHVCHRPGRCRHRASEGEDLMLTCRRAVPCRHHVTARGRRPPLRGVPACRAAGGVWGGRTHPRKDGLARRRAPPGGTEGARARACWLWIGTATRHGYGVTSGFWERRLKTWPTPPRRGARPEAINCRRRGAHTARGVTPMTLITPTESTAVVTAAPANETSSAKRARRGGGRPSAYLAKDGTPCIGVTSVCSRVKESAALIAWANKEGLAGRSIHETRDRACEVGHYAHALVDASIHERERPPRPNGMNDEDEGRALKAFEAYATWRDHHQVEIIDTEVPLVCNLFRFGGTRDALAKVMGELILFDWKSSNDVYREYIMQIAAYRHLARVNGMGDLKSAGLVRFGKAYGNFEYHYWPEALLDDGWDAFKYALEFCKLDQKLKQAVR